MSMEVTLRYDATSSLLLFNVYVLCALMCLLLCAKMCSNSDSRLGQLLPIYKSSFKGGLDIRPDLVTIIDSCSGSIGGGLSGGFEIRPDLVTIIGSSSNGIGGGIGGGVTLCCSLGIPDRIAGVLN